MKYLYLFLLLIFSAQIVAQENYFSAPLRIPLRISGSFAELRTNHFHSGIDLKTEGRTGIPVYASADGYVSRISVAPGGYGKALYVDHPNGKTTVYGHLGKFRDDIGAFIEARQYKERSFQINVFPNRGKFKVKKGELLGWSGNSGSSGGPHLHFEVRDTKTSGPENPLLYGFPVNDQTPPRLFSLMIAPLEKNARIDSSAEKQFYTLKKNGRRYKITGDPLIRISGKTGFAILANDYFDDTWNKCGINEMELSIDGEVYFTYRINAFSFSTSRYINSQIDYETYTKTKQRYLKTWRDPGNQLPTYPYVKEDGSLLPDEGRVYTALLSLKDSYGNTSVLEFNLLGEAPGSPHPEEAAEKTHFYMDRKNAFKTASFQLDIPKNAMYRDIQFEYFTIPPGADLYSDIHIVHKETVPLHKGAQLRIRSNYLGPGLEDKCLLVKIDPQTGEFSAAGGESTYGWVQSTIYSFGHYAVAIDTLSPVVTPVNLPPKKPTTTTPGSLKFKVEDDLSGIQSIQAFLDGQWMLMEYDPKTNTIEHRFNPQRFELDKLHTFRLEVKDNKNNHTIYETSFYR